MFHLRTLVLRSTDVTDDGLYEIGLGCRKLEAVFLENCKKIGAQGVVDLIANCTGIRALKVFFPRFPFGPFLALIALSFPFSSRVALNFVTTPCTP